HEHRGVFRLAQFSKLPNQLPGELHALDGAADDRPLTRRKVGRKIEDRQWSSKRLHPVLEMLFGIFRRQPFLLPDSEIGVLNGQARNERLLSPRQRFVCLPQFALKDALRPTVGDKVVQNYGQYVLFRSKAKQPDAQSRLVLEIEHFTRLLEEHNLQLAIALL